jgi:hypothetical protein
MREIAPQCLGKLAGALGEARLLYRPRICMIVIMIVNGKFKAATPRSEVVTSA